MSYFDVDVETAGGTRLIINVWGYESEPNAKKDAEQRARMVLQVYYGEGTLARIISSKRAPLRESI